MMSSQWLEWHPEANVLLAGTADGNAWMWKIPSGDCKTFQSHGCRSTCGVFMKDGKWIQIDFLKSIAQISFIVNHDAA